VDPNIDKIVLCSLVSREGLEKTPEEKP
jgi:hypothetical protein